MNNAIYIPWYNILFFLKLIVASLFAFILFLVFYIPINSSLNLPKRSSHAVNPMFFLFFFSLGVSLWNLPSLVPPSSSLVWTGCSLNLLHRCHSSITFYHCPRNSLPLSSGFFCFLDPRSSPFIVYFCFVGVSPSFLFYLFPGFEGAFPSVASGKGKCFENFLVENVSVRAVDIFPHAQ